MSEKTIAKRGGTFYPPMFQNLQKEMAQMLDHFRGISPPHTMDEFFQNSGTLVPAIDVAETETGLEISADIPGVADDDLDITVHGDTLVIKGEKSADREEKDKDYHLVERRYGSFRRHIPLGFAPEDGAVAARFTNGVLKLEIKRPATAPSGVHKVKIAKS